MAHDIIDHVHGLVPFIVKHANAAALVPADMSTVDVPVHMIRCSGSADRHIWITPDSEHGERRAIAFYTITFRDDKRRSLKVEMSMRGGTKSTLSLNGFNVRYTNEGDWDTGVREFAEWLKSKTDYDIE